MPLFALAPPPPLPDPPPPVIRTTEELGIDLKTHYDPPPPPQHIGDKIAQVAGTVLHRYKSGDRSPSYNGVRFDGAARNGRCQQNVRDLVEASIYGKPDVWQEAGCCAGKTRRNLHAAALKGKYLEIKDIEQLRPGDLVYLSGGYTCSRCRGGVGHAMVCMGRRADGNLMMWQNTSCGGRKLCLLPLVQWQSRRFVAAYRFPSPKPKVIPKVAPKPTQEPLITLRRPLDPITNDPMMRHALGDMLLHDGGQAVASRHALGYHVALR